MKYDYLIVGSGLFGATCAYELTQAGKKCLVVEKRNLVGGNIRCEEIEGINVHSYGAHIFHTSDDYLWWYINQFAKFNNFVNSPIANYKGELYNLPFNMNTFYKLYGVDNPTEAERAIMNDRPKYNINVAPRNLEEQAISMVGRTMYEKLIFGYTYKQWNRDPKDLPASIIKRLPLRFTFDNNYFNDRYQGIPIGGYNQIITKMLHGVDVVVGSDYLKSRPYYDNVAEKVIYTGEIDKFYHCRFGRLEYRSLKFEHQVYDMKNFQGVAVMNFTDIETPYTRRIEHKHFEFGIQPKTVVTYEYPQSVGEPYYPVNDERNKNIYRMYRYLAMSERKHIFGGRLAEYQYYDMHQVLASALKTVERLLNPKALFCKSCRPKYKVK